MWLTESRLVAVQCDHDCALECFVREFSFATRHQRFMCVRIENRMIDVALLIYVHQFVVSNVLMFRKLHSNETAFEYKWWSSNRSCLKCTHHCVLFFVVQQTMHTLLEFLPKIEAIRLQSGRTFQPFLH